MTAFSRRSIFIFALFVLCLPGTLFAQGYIDCATILNDDSDWINSDLAAKTLNGYTYIYLTLWHSDPLTAGSFPVINGEDWHTGNEIDAYLAVIDPNCNQILGTYIGGSNDESGDIMEIDANGNIIITGWTGSTDFATTDGTTHSGAGNDNIFIRKYAQDGTLLFSTLIGGTDGDSGAYEIVFDGMDIYLSGYTLSSDFPTTNGTTPSGSSDYFVLKLDGNGNLQYSTVHGGSGEDKENKITINNGQVVLMGQTRSSDFPSTDGTTYSGGFDDASLTLFDASGNVVFSTVYGGNSNENGKYDEIFVRADGTYIYTVGETHSTDFPTTDGSTQAGNNDIYFRKYDLQGNLIVSKLFGGTGSTPISIEIMNGNFYVLGNVAPGYPTTDGSTVSGNNDALVMSLDTNGNINFATVYGGSSNDAVVGFYVASNGEIYLNTNSNNAPTTDGSSGEGSVFAKFNSDGSLCAASIVNNDPSGNYTTYYPEVINDTMYVLKHQYSSDAISTDGTVYAGSENLSVVKFVFCPPVPTGTTSTLTPSTINVCQNGLIDQIDGEEILIDGSTFPQIYQGGGPQYQSDIELNYQWQSAISNTGPWSDVPGPLAQQQNFTPPPTTTDLYYRRIATASECCGGAEADISSVTAVLVTSDAAPTVDAGGVFYTCPGGSVTIGGSPTATGGTPMYTYSWEDGTYTTSNPTVTPSQSGVYTLEVTDANGCLQVDQATVTIYSADAGVDTDVCDGAATLIGGSPLSGVPIVPAGGSSTPGEFNVSYDWAPKDGSLSCTDCPNPSANPTVATLYTLTVTMHYPDGTTTCNSTDDVTVGVVSPPSGAMTIEEAVLCLGETIELGANLPPINAPAISSVNQTNESPAGWTGTVANLADGLETTGASTSNGTANNIVIDLGSTQTINQITWLPRSGDHLYRLKISYSTDDITYTTLHTVSSYGDRFGGIIPVGTVDVRYFKIESTVSYYNANVSEFSAAQDYTYVWTPGDYISTSGGSAIFDPGNTDMPTPNPITYTVSATLGTCTWYEQVTVAVIEARANEDNCGPRTIGEADRTLSINETYTWTMIADPSITTGTGSFLDATDQAVTSVSASVGGDVGYELTTTYSLPGGATGTCKDTVIVIPTCGGPTCDIDVQSGGCPDFSDGETILTAIPENFGDPADWTYSWTSNEGMVGLDNYNSQEVTLTDDVTRTYTVTMTSVLDPTYTCQVSLLVNDPAFSKPTINVTSPVTTCKGTPISIGDPANNPGLTYLWTNASYLDNASLSYPEATVNTTTEFILKATDNVTGCFVLDTVLVIVPTSANAGPDFVVCDNGVVQIGMNTDTLGFTYLWEPAGADWRNGTDQFDAMPEVFIATTQQFILTATDTSGTCVSKDTVDVTVENIPASFTLPDVDFCPSQGTLVLGNDDGTTGGASQMPAGYEYLWSGGSVNDATLENPEVNAPLPTTSTAYTVKVSTPGGCNVTATQTFNPLISAPLTVSPASVCVGAPHAIGDASNPATVNWTSSPDVNADLSTATGSNPIFTPTSTGTFTFTASYTNGGCTSTAEVAITVQEATAPSLTPVTICEGNAVQLGVPNDPTLSYQWDPVTRLDDPYISNPTFSGTVSTNYTLTIVNGNGCIAESSTSVTVNPAPAIMITQPDKIFCSSDSISTVFNPTISPLGNYGYNWSPGINLSSTNDLNPTFFIPGSGNYTYTLELIDQATGCSLFDTLNIEATYFTPGPIASANVSSVCSGSAVDLSVTVSEPNVNYQWQSSISDCSSGFSDIVSATTADYTDSPTQETYYRVIVSDANNNCLDTSNCVTVATMVCPVYDWGDLPDTAAGTSTQNYETDAANSGPSHQVVAGLSIGTLVDDEGNGQASSDALGDGADEDGFSFPNTLDITPGGQIILPLDITNTTGSIAHFEVWIDWDGDGDFNSPNEMVVDISDDGAGNFGQTTITINIPTDAIINQSFGLRARLSNTDNMTPYGEVDSGEVEDYLIVVDCKSQICLPIQIIKK